MKKRLLIIFAVLIVLALTNLSFAQYSGTGSNGKTTKVKTYVKKDGSVINGHYRTKENSYNLDNYKAKGNYNPHTGKTGTTYYKSPYNSLQKNSYKTYTPKVKSYTAPKIKTYSPPKIKSFRMKKFK